MEIDEKNEKEIKKEVSTTLVVVKPPSLDVSKLRKFIKNEYVTISHMMGICKVQSPSGKEQAMIDFLKNRLDRIYGVYYEIDVHGNILITKGNVGAGEYYPCIVAHMDRVHGIKQDYKIVQGNLKGTTTKVMWAKAYNEKSKSFTDVGGVGDDANGIYIVLEALKNIDVLKAAFFVEEEVGCKGSKAVDMEFFSDCGYILQGDRKGSSDLILDYISSDVVSKEFTDKCKPIFEHYNFKKASGSFTDVMELADRQVGICVFNFSVGYYNAHTDLEYTVVNELINSTEFALNLITYLGNNKFAHKYEKYKYSYDYSKYNYSSHRGSKNWEDWDDYYGYGWEDSRPYKKKCTCSDTHLLSDTFSLKCGLCNPIIAYKSTEFCSCGTLLTERRHNFVCNVCSEIYMKENIK